MITSGISKRHPHFRSNKSFGGVQGFVTYDCSKSLDGPGCCDCYFMATVLRVRQVNDAADHRLWPIKKVLEIGSRG